MRVILVLAAACSCLGCDSGLQRGKFTVSGSQGTALADGGGWVTTFTGSPQNNYALLPRTLLVVIYLGSEFESGLTSHETYLSTEHVESPLGVFQIEWNRESERVKIHGAEYRRTDGNVFLIRIQDGKIVSQQVGSTDAADIDDILAFLKTSLPNDGEIQALAPRPEE